MDSGTQKNKNNILQYLKKIKIKPENLKLIILTHHHPDHTGSAEAIRKATGCKIAIHKYDKPYLTKEKTWKPKGLKKLITTIINPFIKTPKIQPDITINEKTKLTNKIKIIHTPGHTPGSICIYIPNKAIITGDTIRTNKKANITGYSKIFTANPQQTEKSIKKITQLKFTKLLPGHGKPILENADKKLKEYINNKSK
ncbi:MAG: MBL fold metallo-hydrolase [Candidatus Odinarchaeia archaeon]